MKTIWYLFEDISIKLASAAFVYVILIWLVPSIRLLVK